MTINGVQGGGGGGGGVDGTKHKLVQGDIYKSVPGNSGYPLVWLLSCCGLCANKTKFARDRN